MSTDQEMSDIDKAIATMNARKAKKAGTAAPAQEGTVEASTATETGKRAKLTDADKANKELQRELERAARKSAKEKERAEKLAAKVTRTPHMSKVERAAEKLPSLSNEAAEAFSELTANFSRDQIAALAAHLGHFNRVQATSRALKCTFKTGDRVTIVGGDSRFTGAQGNLTKVQRIRCYVSVPGSKKEIYLFLSDVEPAAIAADEPALATG
jgi:hypothetical protein